MARTACFLGCFGCSGEKMKTRDEVNSGSRRRWISKWNFRFKKSDDKTVPLKLTTVSQKSFHLSKKHSQATSDATWEIQVVEEDASLTKKSVIMVEDNHSPATSYKQNIRRNKWRNSLKSKTGSSRSHRKEAKAATTTATGTTLDQPGKKLVRISYPVVSSSSKPLTHSTPPKGKKPPHAPPADGGADKVAFHKTPPSAGGFDSLIAPRLVASGERSAVSTAEKRHPHVHSNLDLESMEYKKKVVLEGILQRNHRNVVGQL